MESSGVADSGRKRNAWVVLAPCPHRMLPSPLYIHPAIRFGAERDLSYDASVSPRLLREQPPLRPNPSGPYLPLALAYLWPRPVSFFPFVDRWVRYTENAIALSEFSFPRSQVSHYSLRCFERLSSTKPPGRELFTVCMRLLGAHRSVPLQLSTASFSADGQSANGALIRHRCVRRR